MICRPGQSRPNNRDNIPMTTGAKGHNRRRASSASTKGGAKRVRPAQAHASVVRWPEFAVDAVDQRSIAGPFDIIGDVHGCLDELKMLLKTLGYKPQAQGGMTPPEGRRLLFVGDLIDRGPRNVDVLRFVTRLIADGVARSVLGNHDDKARRWMIGNNVTVAHGLDVTVDEMADVGADERAAFAELLASFPTHLWLDGGALVVAHAGLTDELFGQSGGKVRSFALYGATNGERDEYGLPVRLDWAADYGGEALVVYGHTPRWSPRWLNNTANIDTACCFGGHLTALRYPEREIVQVKAHRAYAQSARPLPD